MADIVQNLVFTEDGQKQLDAFISRLEEIERRTRDVEKAGDKMGRGLAESVQSSNKKVAGAIEGFGKMIKSLTAIGATIGLVDKLGDAIGAIAGKSQAVSDAQEGFKGKLDQLTTVLSQKLGPVFTSFIDIASNGLDKVIGFVSKLNDSVGVKFAAGIKASAAVTRAFFSDYGKLVNVAIKQYEIFFKRIQQAADFIAHPLDSSKRDSLGDQIKLIKQEQKDLVGGLENLGTVWKTTYDEAYKQTKKLSEKGVFKLTKQTAEARKEAEKLRKEYEKLYDQLAGKIQAAQLEQLTPVDRAKAELGIALQELDALQQALEAKAKALGKPADFSKEIQDLKDLATLKTNRQIDQLNTPDTLATPDLSTNLLPTNYGDSKSLLKYTDSLVGGLAESTGISVKKKNPFDALKLKLQETFNLDDGQLNEILGQVGNAFGSILDSFTQLTDAQIEENDRYIQSIEDRKQATIDALNDELRNQQDGYANNVSAKRAELESIQKEEARALQKKAELDKKKARQQLIQDALTQTSSLATGAAQLIAAEAGKGLIGIALAAAAIAFMFKIFAGAKRNAAESTQKLYKGGSLRKRRSGFVDRGGRDDRFTRGYHIQDTDLEVGGDEFLMNAKSSIANESFMEDMNTGRYDGVDLKKVVATGLVMNARPYNEHMKSIGYRTPSDTLTNKSMDRIVDRLGDRIITYLKNDRPVVYPAGGYTAVSKGGKKVRTVRPEESVTDLLRVLISKVS